MHLQVNSSPKTPIPAGSRPDPESRTPGPGSPADPSGVEVRQRGASCSAKWGLRPPLALPPSLTYEPHYGLKEKPFSLSADPRFLPQPRARARRSKNFSPAFAAAKG